MLSFYVKINKYMKKRKFSKIISVLLLLIIFACATIFYLNKVVLPVKLKSLIIRTIESQIQKKVSLESMQFNLLKGIVLRNINIYDGQSRLIGIKEASCALLILPVFKERKIIVPSIRLIEPAIFLQRKRDNTLNLIELLSKEKTKEGKPRFSLVVSGANVTNGRIDFQDDTISPSFTKSITGLDIDVAFSMPSSIKFEARGNIQAAKPLGLRTSGSFSIPHKELTAKIFIQNLSPKEFSPYYSATGLDIKDGTIDASIDAYLKDGLLDADIMMQNKNLFLSKDAFSLLLNADIAASLQYWLKEARYVYSGEANISKTDLSGIEAVKEIKGINAKVHFNNEGASSEKMLASVFGLPVEAKISLADFKNPSLSIGVASALELSKLQQIAAEQFKVLLPAEITGGATLSLSVETKLTGQQPPQIRGSLDVRGGFAKIDKIEQPFKNIDGFIEFDMDSLKWSRTHFTYLDTAYTTDGSLTGYKNPKVNLALSSSELSLDSGFAIKGKIIEIERMVGSYLNSKVSLKGSLDITDAQSIRADLLADCEVNLKDIAKNPPDKFKERLEQIKPSGTVKAAVSLKGSINQLKLCTITFKATSNSFSLYGLKSDGFLLNYFQSNAIANITALHLSLYDGTLDASAKVNLDIEDLPFWIEAKVNDVKIEALKQDTPISKQDIAGTLQAITRVNGFLGDFTKLSGSGEILVRDGKLWELNLFEGLGKLIFTKDFTNVIFSKGYCEFFIRDKFIFSDNIQLESDLANLKGKGKIGFDSSVDVDINVEISSEFIPQTGTMKDVTSVLMGEVPKFAVIKIRGTLHKPEYVFDMAVLDVIKGVTETIFEGIFGR
jgi:hypothetical protein